MESSTATPDKTAPPAGDAPAEPLEGEGAQGADAAAGDQAADKPKVPALALVGRGKQLSLKITGDAPDKATAKMVGGKIDIPAGEYQPGDVVEVVCRIRCTKVSVTDKLQNGEVIEREREHQFKLMQMERVDD